jgi:uncharacterized protein
MISQKDRIAIIRISKKYKMSRLLLFGSSASPDKEGNDIDLAVEGIAPADFFIFYGDLLFNVSKPVDLIDLSSKSRFNKMIAVEGIPING